ncbi:hypothetical protein CKU38_04544 (plasmid) [Xanthomonas citri pv. fuscans]|nr:hypothetical protein CKU38_04544 [Xanthomonas citri pv. fuscans]
MKAANKVIRTKKTPEEREAALRVGRDSCKKQPKVS